MRRSTLLLAVQALVLLTGGGPAAASSAPPASPPPVSPTMIGNAARPTGGAAPLRERFVAGGLAIEVTIDPVTPNDPARPELREGDEAIFRFRVTDAGTGTPVSGIYPAGWMSRIPPGVEPATASCQDKVEELVGGSLFSRPEFDLNSYHVLALNEDATISVVDPFFGFGGSKLLAMLFLDSPGEDWALTADKKRLFVTLPAVNRVAVADTNSWKVTAGLETGPNPRRVAFQPDRGYLWVVWEGGVDAFDPRGLTRSARILTGRGAQEIAFSDDNRFAFVTNRVDGTVSIIDVRTLAKVRDVRTGTEPVSVAWTTIGRAAWVSHADGALVAVDGESAEPRARLRTDAGLGRIAFAPGGRFGFVVNPRTDRVHILDVSRGRIVQTGQMEKEPDLVAFSDDLAYVRHRGSETVLMIPLGAIGEEGAPVPVVDFPGGQKPFGQDAGPATASGIVQAPGARAVLVANPADRAVYFYKEGMAAPMGSFANYSRQPRAVMVIDRSLKESAPGVYESVTKLGRPGWYDLAFFLDAPRIVRCLRVAIDPDPEMERKRRAAQPPRVEYLSAVRTVVAGRPFPLRLRILDPASGEPIAGLADVTVLSYQPPGTRQRRQPAREVGAGIYEIALVAEEPGSYYVYVQSLSKGLPFRASPALHLTATGEPSPAP
jgi:YVTN family beta-propeller protein